LADAFDSRLTNMLELKIRRGYSQAPVLKRVKVVDNSSPSSPAKMPSNGKGSIGKANFNAL